MPVKDTFDVRKGIELATANLGRNKIASLLPAPKCGVAAVAHLASL